MKDWEKLKNKKRIVIKVGTSNLTYANGKVHFDRIEKLTRVISDLQNSGKQIILVSSGAIAVGCGKLHKMNKPKTLAEKQALAAIGQAELMKIYQQFFSAYNQTVAQILLTKDVVTDPIKNKNARNTFNTLLKMNIIPIINENDTVATDEIEHLGYGDNDRLSADVAVLAQAGLLIILSDIDGLFSSDPHIHKNAVRIPKVVTISKEIEKMALGTKSAFARGGMTTKIAAAKICSANGIDTVITNGKDLANIYSITNGKESGTLFLGNKMAKKKQTH